MLAGPLIVTPLKAVHSKTQLGSSGSESPYVQQDGELVLRCLAGDAGSWRQLYCQCHGPLLAAIHAYLGPSQFDKTLVDEIAARVWYRLVQNNCEVLKRFDVNRGCRLATYLSMLAKTQSRILLRSERRRRTREREVCRPEMRFPNEEVPCDGNLSEQEFVDTLTSLERTFYREVLSTPAISGEKLQYRPPEISQLRHRIKKKLARFLQGETPPPQEAPESIGGQ